MEAFYYMQPITLAIQKAYQLLEDDGRCIVGIDYYEENKGSHHWPKMLDLNLQLYSSEQWERSFTDAGFKKVQLSQVRDKDSDVK